jgi:hypothetical protein
MKTSNASFVKRALWLFTHKPENAEKPLYDTVNLTAVENAIPKAIIISEVVRRRIRGLY